MHRAECFSDSTHMLPSQPEGYLVSITTVKLQSSQDCLYWTLKPVFRITAVPSQRATIHRKIDTVIGSSSSKSVVKIILMDYSNSIFNLPPRRLKQKSVLGKGTDWCHSFTTYARAPVMFLLDTGVTTNGQWPHRVSRLQDFQLVACVLLPCGLCCCLMQTAMPFWQGLLPSGLATEPTTPFLSHTQATCIQILSKPCRH